MKKQLFTLLLLITTIIGCSKNDYDYSGNVIFSGVTSDMKIYIYIFESSSIFMELPVMNGKATAELIPGYYSVKISHGAEYYGPAHFQIIAGKSSHINYSKNDFIIKYE